MPLLSNIKKYSLDCQKFYFWYFLLVISDEMQLTHMVYLGQKYVIFTCLSAPMPTPASSIKEMIIKPNKNISTFCKTLYIPVHPLQPSILNSSYSVLVHTSHLIILMSYITLKYCNFKIIIIYCMLTWLATPGYDGEAHIYQYYIEGQTIMADMLAH